MESTGLTASAVEVAANGTAGHRTSGPVRVTPDSQQYLDLVSGLNQRWIGHPESVFVVSTTSDVVKVVQEAVDKGKRLTVRSGGHCFEDFVFNADVRYVIDMSEMRQITYDTTYQAVSIDAGATVLRVYEELYREWGVTIPAGFCANVGMGGLVTGGGWGALVRRNGLVVDHLYGVEVVTVNAYGQAKVIIATREPNDPNRDLWWAHTGGGGGTFGVVTRFLFRSPNPLSLSPQDILPRPPREVLLNAIAWPWAELDKSEVFQLARNYASWHVANISPTNPNRAISAMMQINHISNGFAGMITQVDADLPNAEQLLDDFLAYMNRGITVSPGPMTVAMGEFAAMPNYGQTSRLPWLQTTRYLGMTNPVLNDPTMRADYKSAYLVGVPTDAQLEAMYKHLTRPDIRNPNVNIGFTPYGGAANAVAPTATASVHRGAAFKMLWSAFWTNPADDGIHTSWTRECYQEMFAATGGVPVANSVTDGCYVNYADEDLSNPQFNRSSTRWHDLYFKENYPKLQQVKKKYDPKNIFRHRQSVELPS